MHHTFLVKSSCGKPGPATGWVKGVKCADCKAVLDKHNTVFPMADVSKLEGGRR